MTKPPIVKVHKQRHIVKKKHVKFNFRNRYDSIGSDVGRVICLKQHLFNGHKEKIGVYKKKGFWNMQ
jgi:hypothetical protein